MGTQDQDPRYKDRDSFIKAFGPCVQCGSSDRLEVDHIDPRTKKYRPHTLGKAVKNPDTIRSEFLKCQVLCKECHIRKSCTDRGFRILTQQEIDLIFTYRAVGRGSGSISKELGVSDDTIWRILKGYSYKHLTQKHSELIANPRPDRNWHRKK